MPSVGLVFFLRACAFIRRLISLALIQCLPWVIASLRVMLKRPSVQRAIALTRGYAQGNYAAFANKIQSASVLERSLVYRPVVIERHRKTAMQVMTAAYHATSALPVPQFAKALCLTPGSEFDAWFAGRVRELDKR